MQPNDMSSYSKSAMVPGRGLFTFVSVVMAIIFIRYYLPVHVPGPMVHPIKYRIISGTFALILDISYFMEKFIGIPHYSMINMVVDSFDPIKIRPFDRGQVLYNDEYIEGVLVRVYTPQNVSNSKSLPLIIFFHGGGFFFGSIYSHDTMTYHLSLYSGAKVIAINYRLTPSVHFPTPIDEGLQVAKHILDNPEKFSIDPKRIFLCGDSAGGNMAVVVEHRLRREGQPRVDGVLLLYPLLQMVNFRLPSYRRFLPYRILSILREETLVEVTNFYVNTTFNKDDLFNNKHLSPKDYKKFFAKLHIADSSLKINEDRSIESSSAFSHPDTEKLFDANVSPLLADDEIFLQTPATFIVACSYDVLLSDARIYNHRLQKLKVQNITYREYQIFHGVMTFVDFPVAFDEAFDIIRDSAQFVVNRTALL